MTTSENKRKLARDVLRVLVPGDVALLQYLYWQMNPSKTYSTDEILKLAEKEDCGRLWKIGLLDMNYVSTWKACGWRTTELGELVLAEYYDLEDGE